jgi:2-dehydro-3-deoxyglucarate aldolase/4-hydroxy-2-oxoheptanedioate aldolase
VNENRVKRTLRQGGTALGTMVFEFNTTGMARLTAAAGADFAVVDMEHSGWSMETVRGMIATARAAELPLFVRVPATEYHFLARALDVGAMGLMVPMVETEAQAQRIVAAAKYPPHGRRGAAFGVAHDDYRDGDLLEKMASANAEGLLIAQIETAQGVENVDRIAAVAGIDVLWIGHFDLTNSLGIPGQFTHPEFRRAVDRVLAACARHDRAAGFMVATVDEGRQALAQGFRCLAYWGDLWLYRRALQEGLLALRAAPG